METVISCVNFLLSKAGKFKTSMARMPYNKLLTNLASSSCTGKYWPSVVVGCYSAKRHPAEQQCYSRKLKMCISLYLNGDSFSNSSQLA